MTSDEATGAAHGADRSRSGASIRARRSGKPRRRKGVPSPAIADLAARAPLPRLCAAFEFVTPAVIGGQDNTGGPAELRLESFMGALRFWWRALAWGPAWRMAGGGERDALRIVQLWQGALFGSAGKPFGQGAIRVRMTAHDAGPVRTSLRDRDGTRHTYGYAEADVPAQSFGLQYLAGQGFKASAIAPGARAVVRFDETRAWRAATSDAKDSLAQGDATGRAALGALLSCDFAPLAAPRGDRAPPGVADALEALDLFGCIGSRARRGFGAACMEREDIGGDPDREARARDLLRRFADITELPPYTAFSSRSSALLVKFDDTSVAKAHDFMGVDLLRYRGYGRHAGRHHRTVGADRVPMGELSAVAVCDHRDWYEGIRGELVTRGTVSNLNFVPKRSQFGLPNNVYSSRPVFTRHRDRGAVWQEINALSGDWNEGNTRAFEVVSINLPRGSSAPGTSLDRRAGPVFLKLASDRAATPLVVASWLFLPARAVPDSLRVLEAVARRHFEARRSGPTDRRKTTLSTGAITANFTATIPASMDQWATIVDFLNGGPARITSLARDNPAGHGTVQPSVVSAGGTP